MAWIERPEARLGGRQKHSLVKRASQAGQRAAATQSAMQTSGYETGAAN
jgi:hypothetical protein